MRTRASILILVALCLAPVATQERQDAQPQTPRFGANTTAIIVDAVVRDKKGLPVTNLAGEDFELHENGIRQEIADVTVVPPGVMPACGPSSSSRRAATPPSSVASNRAAPERSAVTTPVRHEVGRQYGPGRFRCERSGGCNAGGERQIGETQVRLTK